MASIIKIKRSTTTSAVPSSGSLSEGELAVNITDGLLWVGDSSGDPRALSGSFTVELGDGAGGSSSNTDIQTSLQIEAGEGIDITKAANGAYVWSGEDASTSNKGIASFDTTSFTVSSGAVSAKDLTLSGDTGSAAATIGESMTIAGTDAQGIDTSATGTTVTITAKDATDSQKGVASFDSTHFSVSSGAVSASDLTLAGDTGTSAATLGETFTIAGTDAQGIDTSATGTTVTITAKDATTSQKGVASFSTDNFSVSSGAVTIKDGGVVNAEIADKTILNGKIADGTLSSTQISSKGIFANSIADAQITSTQIGSKAISANSIADGVITSTQLAPNAITANAVGDNSVALGTKTTGNYVATISGTASEIEVSGSGSETASVTIGLPNDVTIGNDLTITNDVAINGTTGSTSTSSGALVVDGGVGIAENIFVGGDARISGDTVIDGSLTVEGGVTYISSSTVNVDDSMIKLSANNSADSADSGVYAMYVDGATTKYAGYFRDSTDEIFKFYKESQSEPGTTVDTGATGYALAQVDAIIDGGTF